MQRRLIVLLSVIVLALTLPLAAAVLSQRVGIGLSEGDISALLLRRGYKDVRGVTHRGDVMIFDVTLPKGQKRQLVVTRDGTIVGDRAQP